MSVDNLNQSPDLASTAAPMQSDDEALGAMFDQISTDAAATGRDGGGRFTSQNKDTTQQASTEAPETPLEGEGGGEAEQNADSTPVVPAAPLPANWQGKDEVWAKLSPDDQKMLAPHFQELHQRMSDQGRQISAVKPLADILDKNKDLYAGRKLHDGSEATPQVALERLLNAQRMLEANPAQALLTLAERFGVRDEIAAALTNGQAPKTPAPTPQRPAGISPAEIERLVRENVSAATAEKAAEEEVNRLMSSKPLASRIAEDDMVHAIHMARARLGEAASKEAVFDLAYDMAVHADPVLRAEVAVASKPTATTKDPKRTEEARRAASVNVTSTSTGKARDLSEDEVLARAYDEATN